MKWRVHKRLRGYKVNLLILAACFGQLIASPQLSPQARASWIEMLKADSVLNQFEGFASQIKAYEAGDEEALAPWARLEAHDPDSDDQGREGEFLIPGLFYSQLEHFESAEIERLKAEWRQAQPLGADTLLLDLRTSKLSDDPSALLPLLEALVPPHTVLYRRVREGEELEAFSHHATPFWKGDLVILVDQESSDLARLLAIVLNHLQGSPIFGQWNSKECFSYAPLVLNETLRGLVAEAQLRLDPSMAPAEALASKVVPLSSSPEGKMLWRRDKSRDLKSRLFEQAPRRFDEKALMEQKNPDFDLPSVTSTASDLAPIDSALIQAVDLLVAKRFLKADKLALPERSNGGNMFELPKDP